jgi:hypothetical protein
LDSSLDFFCRKIRNVIPDSRELDGGAVPEARESYSFLIGFSNTITIL